MSERRVVEYAEGSWFFFFFYEFPSWSIHIENGTIYAVEYPSGTEVHLNDPRPDEPEQAKVWDSLSAIPDLM